MTNAEITVWGEKMELDRHLPYTVYLKNPKILNKHKNMKGKTIKPLEYRKISL